LNLEWKEWMLAKLASSTKLGNYSREIAA
jgi:hypothetical protein